MGSALVVGRFLFWRFLLLAAGLGLAFGEPVFFFMLFLRFLVEVGVAGPSGASWFDSVTEQEVVGVGELFFRLSRLEAGRLPSVTVKVTSTSS